MKKKNKSRKRLYVVKTGFKLVRDVGQDVSNEDRFHDFLIYLWECCPSGILNLFQEWILEALHKANLQASYADIDNALSAAFLEMERARNEQKKSRK